MTEISHSEVFTALVRVEPWLAEYARNEFGAGLGGGIVRFPRSSPLHHVLSRGMMRPRGLPCHRRPEGNLRVVLPDVRSADSGPAKNPRYHTQVTREAQSAISAGLRQRFNYQFLTSMMSNELKGRPVPLSDMVHRFLRRHGVTLLTEDALVKKFLRYRRMVAPQQVRKYTRRTVKSD